MTPVNQNKLLTLCEKINSKLVTVNLLAAELDDDIKALLISLPLELQPIVKAKLTAMPGFDEAAKANPKLAAAIKALP